VTRTAELNAAHATLVTRTAELSTSQGTLLTRTAEHDTARAALVTRTAELRTMTDERDVLIARGQPSTPPRSRPTSPDSYKTPPGTTVYVLQSGSKYHTRNGCGTHTGGNSHVQIDLTEARRQGYTFCANCAGRRT
jgi:hypothetical protein